MKKFYLLLIVGLSSLFSLCGGENLDYSFEGQVFYFYPFSNRVRDIYGNGWADYQIQANQTFCKRWTLWEGLSWWGTRGHSTCLHNETTMRLLSLRMGIQHQFDLNSCTQIYLGAGFNYNFLRIHDHSHYVKEHTSKNAFGGIAQTGIYYFFAKRYFADFNFEYLYQHFYFSHHEDRPHVKRTNLDLSGIKIGAGLGIQF